MYGTQAQQIGQVFIYILTITIVSIVLIFGYNAIADFRDKTEKISTVKFETDLKAAINSLSSDFGSVVIKNLLVGDVNTVCFVSSFNPTTRVPEMPTSLPTSIRTSYPLLVNSVLGGGSDNVFLITDRVQDSFDVGNIVADPAPVACVPVTSGNLRVQIEGRGNHVIISS